ncbi:MAG: hypothetical protein KIT27_06685 [Legionellales bacterium]|nr:hypothetical protein [Legionellales bacterium]
MTRTIKKVAHDLLPLAEVISELSAIISQLLAAIEPQANFNDKASKQYFSECSQASQKLAISAKLIQDYIRELNFEADQEGILKE